MARTRESQLYMLNLTLLVTHEIDSAYWHEWEMFRIPGGIQVFLILNLLLILLLVVGLARVIERTPGWIAFYYLLAGAGILAAVLHGGFLAAGFDQFKTPVSIGLLVLIFCVSITQFIVIRGQSSR